MNSTTFSREWKREWKKEMTTELEQLKKRIDDSGIDGVETAQIRYDYKPVGQMMIQKLTDSGEYVQRRTPMHDHNSKWRIFQKENKPY